MDGAAASSSRTHVAADYRGPLPEPLRQNQQSRRRGWASRANEPGARRPLREGAAYAGAAQHDLSRWSGT